MTGTDDFSELEHYDVDPRSVRLLDEGFCRDRQVVVLGRVEAGDGPVTVGMLQPSRRSLAREGATRLGRSVRPVRLNAWEIRQALDRGHGRAEAALPRGTLRLGPAGDFSFRGDAAASELIDEILGRAVGLGASDVHIETYAHDVDVRFRVDGVLRQVATPLSRDNIAAAMARLKILADLDIAERRRAQDGRIAALWAGRDGERPIDFRLSVVPGPAGEDAVLRILDRATAVLGLPQLGFSGDDLETFERLVTNPEGLVLVTGPT